MAVASTYYRGIPRWRLAFPGWRLPWSRPPPACVAPPHLTPERARHRSIVPRYRTLFLCAGTTFLYGKDGSPRGARFPGSPPPPASPAARLVPGPWSSGVVSPSPAHTDQGTPDATHARHTRTRTRGSILPPVLVPSSPPPPSPSTWARPADHASHATARSAQTF